MQSLVGAYGDSDEEDGADESPAATGKSQAPRPAASNDSGSGGGAVASKDAARQNGSTNKSTQQQRQQPKSGEASPPQASAPLKSKHRPTCECEDCEGLLARFVAKSLQTKGIRFKCRLCGDPMAAKAAAPGHFRSRHGEELQSFKVQKAPKLFEAEVDTKAKQRAVLKISFAREDVLGKKRPPDEDKSFGGWAKKEKPEPPPCDTAEYQHQLSVGAEPVLTAPPWANAARPTDEDASQMDKEVDGHIVQAQMQRFSKRNVLEVNPTSVRCKLCFKIIGTLAETERHVLECHKEDFNKEMTIWERFLFTTCRRQPPFGWVCKVCSTFFPSDGAVWRHLGKEVFLRREERHATQWHEKEDRWGHEEDEECCGDGMNVGRGLSYDSVKRFNEAARREAEMMEKRDMQGPTNKPEESDEEEETAPPPEEVGQVKFIQEF